jgi:hypothetical protein
MDLFNSVADLQPAQNELDKKINEIFFLWDLQWDQLTAEFKKYELLRQNASDAAAAAAVGPQQQQG